MMIMIRFVDMTTSTAPRVTHVTPNVGAPVSGVMSLGDDVFVMRHNRQLGMWANAQRDGRPDEHRWRPLSNAAKFG